jgi:hypothetical protein
MTATATPGEGRPLADRLVSPNGFDGYGPVPDKVNDAARKIAKLRTRFVSQWTPGCEQPLTTTEVDALFQASAVRAEWERELIEARDALTRERDEAVAVVTAARRRHWNPRPELPPNLSRCHCGLMVDVCIELAALATYDQEDRK